MGKSIIGLDIGTNSIKLVELKKGKAGVELARARLKDIETGDLSALKPEEKTKAVQDATRNAVAQLLKEEKLKSCKVCIAIGGHSIFVRFMKLPKVAKRRADQIVRYEAQQQVPFPIDEVVWDYQIFRNGDTPEVDVALVAVKKDIVGTLLSGLATGSLDVETVDATPLALYNALQFSKRFETGTVVLDLGARSTNVIIMDNQKMWTRSIPIGGNDVTEALAEKFKLTFEQAEEMKTKEGILLVGATPEEESRPRAQEISKAISSVLMDILAEVTRSIGYYKSQSSGVTFGKLVVAGGMAKIRHLDSFFGNNLDLEVEKIGFSGVVNIPPVLNDVLNGDTARFGVAFGLALRSVAATTISINLLPQELAKAKELKKKSGFIFLSQVLAILTVFSVRGMIMKDTEMEKAKLSGLNKRLEELRLIKEQADGINNEMAPLAKKFAMAEFILKGKTFWLEIVSELGRLMPREMWLTEFYPQEIKGEAAAAPAGQPVPPPGIGGSMPPGRERQPPAAAAPAAQPATGGLYLVISGETKQKDFTFVKKFEEALGASPYFSEVQKIYVKKEERVIAKAAAPGEMPAGGRTRGASPAPAIMAPRAGGASPAGRGVSPEEQVKKEEVILFSYRLKIKGAEKTS